MNWGRRFTRKLILFLADGLLLCLALFLAALVRFRYPVQIFQAYASATVVFVLSFLASFYILDLYNLEEFAPRLQMFKRLVAACLLGMVISSTAFYFLYLSPGYRYGRGIFLLAGLLTVFLVQGARHIYFRAGHTLFRPVRTLVVGTGGHAETIRLLLQRTTSAYEIAGFVRTARELPEPRVPAGQVLGEVSDLTRLVEQHSVGCVVMAGDVQTLPEAEAADLTRLKFNGVTVLDATQFYMQVAEALPVEFLSDSWLLFAEGFELLQAKLARRLKRISDLLLAVAGLLVTLPLGLFTALAIKLDSAGPVLFSQTRVGWLEQPFQLLKFRSMQVGAESGTDPQWASENDRRVTRVGRWLRRLHLDELPQMINVLKGEMSFVGPRPERPEFVKQLKAAIPFYHLRHYVPPGITGWAQVHYPYGASEEDAKFKLQLDLYYIMNASLLLDLRILLQTARVVLLMRGSR